MHEEWEIRNLPREEESWKITKEEVWSERDGVWEMNRCRQIERDRRNENQIAKKWIYRPSVKLDRCRYREVLRKLLREVSRKKSSIAEVSRNNSSDPRTEAWSIHQVSRSYQRGRSFLDLSTRYREAVRKAVRNSWRISTDSKVSRRYRGGVEPAFQNSFLRSEKHKHECIPTCNTTNDPINIWSSQKHLSTIIFKHMDLKNTHTH